MKPKPSRENSVWEQDTADTHSGREEDSHPESVVALTPASSSETPLAMCYGMVSTRVSTVKPVSRLAQEGFCCSRLNVLRLRGPALGNGSSLPESATSLTSVKGPDLIF